MIITVIGIQSSRRRRHQDHPRIAKHRHHQSQHHHWRDRKLPADYSRHRCRHRYLSTRLDRYRRCHRHLEQPSSSSSGSPCVASTITIKVSTIVRRDRKLPLLNSHHSYHHRYLSTRLDHYHRCHLRLEQPSSSSSRIHLHRRPRPHQSRRHRWLRSNATCYNSHHELSPSLV